MTQTQTDLRTAADELHDHERVRDAKIVGESDANPRIIVALGRDVDTVGPIADVLRSFDLQIWRVDFPLRRIWLVQNEMVTYSTEDES